MRIFEIDFKEVKNRFIDENGRLTFSMTTNEDAYPFDLSSSVGVQVQPVGDKLSIINDTSLTVINPSDAKVIYSFNHGYANPVISYAGNYFCIIDQGATRLRLDRANKSVFETKTDKPIICADVAKNGNVVYITRTDGSKSEINVVNSALKKLMKVSVNSGYIVSVAIDSSGKKIAFASVDSKSASFVTTVYTINLGDKEVRRSFDFKDSTLMDLRYSNPSELYYVATNGVFVIRNQKKVHETFKTGEVNTVCFNYTTDNELVYVYSNYSSANENKLVYVNSSGKVKTEIDLKQRPKYISATNDICVLYHDKVVIYSMTKGEVKESFKCDDSVSSADKISTKIFINRNKLIDVLN
jgi:dipeptidyl aminopeptidase/acylaminoacyl peptidase